VRAVDPQSDKLRSGEIDQFIMLAPPSLGRAGNCAPQLLVLPATERPMSIRSIPKPRI
jgi:hypothetical protein